MATDYGIGIAALTDRPDPEQRVSGLTHLEYRLARRLLCRNGALLAIGDAGAYDSLDLRDYLGTRDAREIAQLGTLAQQVLSTDDEVETVSVTASFAGGVLSVAVSGTGADGPFAFVIDSSAVTGPAIRGI